MTSAASLPPGDPPNRRLFGFAIFTLIFSIAVILWGAVVRATKYGDGCGAHWPYCNGEAFPTAPSVPTIVEYSHRVTSGLVMIVTYALTFFAFRWSPPKAPVRRAAVWASIFMTGESVIGAFLVLLKLVAHAESTKRAFSGGLHLINTFLLVAALVATAYFARFPDLRPKANATANSDARMRLYAGGALMLLLGVTGAIAALGDTLFPARTLTEGFTQDLSPIAHLFLRLRAAHPFTAVAGLFVVGYLMAQPAPASTVRLGRVVLALYVLQVVVGLINLLALAPLGLQLVHLLSANVLWIGYSIYGLALLSPKREAITEQI